MHVWRLRVGKKKKEEEEEKKKNMWKCVLCWMQGEKNDEFGVM